MVQIGFEPGEDFGYLGEGAPHAKDGQAAGVSKGLAGCEVWPDAGQIDGLAESGALGLLGEDSGAAAVLAGKFGGAVGSVEAGFFEQLAVAADDRDRLFHFWLIISEVRQMDEAIDLARIERIKGAVCRHPLVRMVVHDLCVCGQAFVYAGHPKTIRVMGDGSFEQWIGSTQFPLDREKMKWIQAPPLEAILYRTGGAPASEKNVCAICGRIIRRASGKWVVDE